MTGASIDPFGSMAPFCLYSLVASLMVHISVSLSLSQLYELKKNWAGQVSTLWGCQEHNVLYICMVLTVVNIWYTFNVTIYFQSYIQQVNVLDSIYYHDVWGDAVKSLAQATSRCCRMELIVSLERGVYSRAESQVFSCYRGCKEACHATRAISTTWRRELSSSFFFPCKARRRRKFTPFWQKH